MINHLDLNIIFSLMHFLPSSYARFIAKSKTCLHWILNSKRKQNTCQLKNKMPSYEDNI